jgi:hypothetical protein
MFLFLVSIISQIQNFIYNLDPAYLDIAKIFAGSIAWIGGFIIFMWLKEKKKKPTPSLIGIEGNY